MPDKMKRVTMLLPAVFFLLVIAVPVLAQGKDELVACIEEVKQIREKEGENWYAKNKTSCLGEGAIGKWSVLKLDEFSKKEVVNDMELEFFAFFDVPVDGVETRESQMEYQETSEPKSPGPGYRTEKKVEKPGIGDKSQHQIETTYVNIAESYSGLSPAWAGYTIYQELVVIVGNCSFMVGGRAAQGDGWSFNHRVDWKNDVVINSDHDHGEEKMKQTMREYARGVMNRISGVCGSLGGATETKKGGVVDWAKGLLARRETPALETKEAELSVEEKWVSVQFRDWTEGVNNKVNDWIMENLGVSEMKIETMEKAPSSPPAVERITESRLLPGAVIKNYRDGVMVELGKGGWVYIPPRGEIIYASDQWRKYFDVLSGETEIETNGEDVGVRTPSATVKPKGTHYWVSYDAAKRVTTVGVYEGEVEIETKDGQIIAVKPEEDKSGVVVVERKLSLWKLALAGGVAVAVVGGIAMSVIRRKKQTGKKRKF